MQCYVPEVPAHLTNEIPLPLPILKGNKGLLILLAEHVSLHRRFNADRAAVHELFLKPGSAGENR